MTAISHLIKQLDIPEDKKETFFEWKGNCQGPVTKYSDTVIKMVADWLKGGNYQKVRVKIIMCNMRWRWFNLWS